MKHSLKNKIMSVFPEPLKECGFEYMPIGSTGIYPFVRTDDNKTHILIIQKLIHNGLFVILEVENLRSVYLSDFIECPTLWEYSSDTLEEVLNDIVKAIIGNIDAYFEIISRDCLTPPIEWEKRLEAEKDDLHKKFIEEHKMSSLDDESITLIKGLLLKSKDKEYLENEELFLILGAFIGECIKTHFNAHWHWMSTTPKTFSYGIAQSRKMGSSALPLQLLTDYWILPELATQGRTLELKYYDKTKWKNGFDIP